MSEPEIIGPDEAFEEPRQGMGLAGKLFAGAAITVGVVALAGAVWFAYQQGIRSGAESAAPVIKALNEPVKRKPEEPGGLEVPHQDKLVFTRLAPGQMEEPIERLLPPPEEPVARPAAPPDPAAGTPDEGAAAQASAGPDLPADEPARQTAAASAPPSPPEDPVKRPETATPPDRAPEGTAATQPPSGPDVPADERAAQKDAPKPLLAVQTPPTPSAPESAADTSEDTRVAAASPPDSAPAPKPAAVDAWRIQLAAVSSRDSALAEWDRLKRRNTDLLGSLSLNVETAKLSRGTFYRIQAGPLDDGAAARSLCGQLKSRNQDCLVVAP